MADPRKGSSITSAQYRVRSPATDTQSQWTSRPGTISTTYPSQPPEQIYGRRIEMPSGWKYKSLKFGPITLPWYASPEAQLVLVSFVCFLCPGKILKAWAGGWKSC